jgi:Zn-finger nucleic acid-binding protein
MVTNDVVTKKAELSYNTCEKCGSLWLDKGDLDKLAFTVEGSIEASSTEVDKTPEKEIKKCPRCDDFNLSRVHFLDCTDIVLHRCGYCQGFWVDGGELNLMDEELTKDMPVSGKGFSDFVNNVHVPYWFKRVKKKSSETDTKITVLPVRGSTLKKATEDKCPACGSLLNLYSYWSAHYEGCVKCKGLWVERDELRKLKNQVELGRLHWMNDEIDDIEKTSARPTSRLCVKCKDVKMVAAVFGHSSLVIDWCPKCFGMWLDHEEFRSIVDYLNTIAFNVKPKEVSKELEKDVKQLIKGGPEGRLAEIGDIDADLHALINASIFEHPKVFEACVIAGKMAQSTGA